MSMGAREAKPCKMYISNMEKGKQKFELRKSKIRIQLLPVSTSPIALKDNNNLESI
jgi:hypothetical protein